MALGGTVLMIRVRCRASLFLGGAAGFSEFCRDLGIPALVAPKRKQQSEHVFMSDRQLRAVAQRFVDETPGPHDRTRYESWRSERGKAGERLPSFQTIDVRFGGLAEALPEAELKSKSEAYWRRVLTRIAREVEVVESATGLSRPMIAEWDELRFERPELGLYSAKGLVRMQIMPWRDLVAPNRVWPSDIEALVAKQVDPDGVGKSADEVYWRGVLARIAHEVDVVEAAGLSEPLMREWNDFRAANPDLGLFTANRLTRLQVMPWREFVAANRVWPSDIDGVVAKHLARLAEPQVSKAEAYWRRTLTRIAREIDVVEAAGLSEPFTREWDEFRAANPDLGLYTANTMVVLGVMPWRQLVAADRVWPSDIDGLVANLVEAAA